MPTCSSHDPVNAVLVHRDQPERCAESITAFEAQTVPIKVTVIDNGSSPRALDLLRRLVPGVEIVETGENLGFGPGANVGFRRWLAGEVPSDGPAGWIVLAPHDALPEPDCVERLLAAVAETSRAGLVSAEFGPGQEFVPVLDKIMGGLYQTTPRGEGWQDVDYPHGTLLLARGEMLREVGLFDERFFAYCEEVDLALRAKRAGWKVGMVWGAVVRNGRLPQQLLADYLQVRNTLLLVQENSGWYCAAWRCLFAGMVITSKAVRNPRQASVHARLEGRAVYDFLRRRFGPPPPSVLDLVG